MSPRKSLQNADTPDLPTIKDYFGMMAEEQAKDIRRLKQAATGKNSQKQTADEADPDPWLLHPIRLAKPAAAKRGANGPTRSALNRAPKKAAKKVARKKTRR